MKSNYLRQIACLFLPFVLCCSASYAQISSNEKEQSPVKFGKIGVEDFASQHYVVDSSANAIILADIGHSKIEGNTKGWFSVIHTHYRRVHILNKAAYDLAEVAINLYVDKSDQEKLIKVKANTYNLEGDKVSTTSISNRDVFTDSGDKNHIAKKFTFPNVKEGSIIEYEYTTSSDFLFNFQPWAFQGTVPRLWSEYNVEIPQFLDYVFLSYGYNPFYIRSDESRKKTFNVQDSGTASSTERANFTSDVKSIRFVMKDVKALKEEPFTSTLSNHISRIEFQLSGYRDPLETKRILGDWKMACDRLLSYEEFGADLSDNKWLNEEVTLAKGKDTSVMSQVKSIYYYIRNNYKCNGKNGIYLSKPGLKNVAKAKGGKIADINLLLTAMLRNIKVEAYPVILSTAENGISHTYYPLMSQYNYVVVKAIIQGKQYLLDATRPSLPFGILMPYCYNGTARTIEGQGDPILLSADSLREASQVYIALKADPNGSVKGSFTKHPGEYESIRLKTKIKDDGLEGLKKEVEKSLGTDMMLDSIAVLDAEDSEKKPTLTYEYTLGKSGENLIFINPLQAEATKKNPFNSTTRNYPIEMPYGFDETIQFSLHVPEGYTLDEMPKSLVISLDEERLCIYQYRIQYSDNKVEVLSRFIFKRANFNAEEYESLRAFFDLVVKKQNEAIVLKKI